MKIKLFITGGTIDAKYDFHNAKVTYGESHIKQMLNQGRNRADVDLEQLMLVDSGDITDEMRQQILERCQTCGTDKIVITHGTDTLTQTAELLGHNIQDKTVVLVGAIIPFAFKNSDALFNLGAAVTAVQLLDKGVFVTMNGTVFSWDNVKKNFDLSEFQTK